MDPDQPELSDSEALDAALDDQTKDQEKWSTVVMRQRSRKELGALAELHRTVLSLFLFIFAIAFGAAFIAEAKPTASGGLLLICILMHLWLAFEFYKMSVQIGHSTGISFIQAAFLFAPCIGLFVLLFGVTKAGSILKSNNIRLGLMGVPMKDIEALLKD
jgi:hypothetical protein